MRGRLLGAGPGALLSLGGLVLPVPGQAVEGRAPVACPDRAVIVVVDFQELPGDVERRCVAEGAGRTAEAILVRAGIALDPVQRQPAFVCRVEGVPTSDPCIDIPPADAYWGLFWSDGESGEWRYATTGVQALEVPAGGFVGFSWQDSPEQREPGPAPVRDGSSVPDAATGGESSTRPSNASPVVDGGLPTWVTPALIGALFVAAAAAGVVRRRRGAAGQ